MQTATEQYELVDLIKQRSENGFKQLFDTYSDALFGVIVAIVVDEAQAEDLLQDTFIKIWKNIDQYNAQKGTFFTWIFNIARFTAIDHLRTRHHKAALKTYKAEKADNSTATATFIPAQHADYIGIKKVVLSLEPKYSEVLNMIYFNGYTYEQTAAKLGIPEGTVKTRVRKAMILLKNLL